MRHEKGGRITSKEIAEEEQRRLKREKAQLGAPRRHSGYSLHL